MPRYFNCLKISYKAWALLVLYLDPVGFLFNIFVHSFPI